MRPAVPKFTIFIPLETVICTNHPQLETKITLKRDGTRLGAPLKQPINVGRITDDLFMYGDALNLAGLPEAGDYTLVFEITDKGAGVTVERTVELHIVD